MGESDSRPLILMVDDDEVLLKMAVVTLKKHGFDVVTAASGEAGFESAKELSPSVVVLDVMLPDITGWTFIKRMRSTPELCMVPVIFSSSLTEPESRLEGFSLGGDDYLSKPFRLDELAFRVQRCLERRNVNESEVRRQLADPQPPAALGGTVGEIGLATILLLLEMERKSGKLAVRQTDGGASAEVLVDSGAVVLAQCDGGSSGEQLRNMDAMCHLLSWTEATFEFTPCAVEVEDEVQTPTSHLLLEAARRADEELEEELV